MATPAADGLHMPAEWEPHARCWMEWPCREALWREQIEAARDATAMVARAIARFEPVTMVARPELAGDARIRCGGEVEVFPLAHDDSWMRDNGPTFVVDGQGGVGGVDWRFNGWGGKYPDCADDAAVPKAVLAQLGMRRYTAPLVLEGGAVHVDGEGTLLATEQCVLNPNRNPELAREDMERLLQSYLGVSKIIWLGEGLEDDETDGHVDNVACFARPGVVLALTSRDAADGNHRALSENLDRLRGATDSAGRRLEVIEVGQPARRDGPQGRLPLSYLNFYIANDAVILPSFGDPEDERARRTIAEAFAERRVVQLPASTLTLGGGGIHCITQQQPSGAALG